VPGAGYKLTAKPQIPEAGEAIVRQADPPETKPPAAPLQRHRPVAGFRAAAMAAIVLVMGALGWATWTNRADLRQLAEVTPRITATETPATPPRPDAAEAERRETVFNRMVAAMQTDRFSWRTVDRLAIESGVAEAQAHEILAEHTDKVMLGKSRDGKLIARLPDR
jgi:hypothetical protein